MDIRFAAAASGDVVAVMAGDGSGLLPAGAALDKAAGGRLAKAVAATRFTGAPGQVVDILAPEGLDFARVLVIGVGRSMPPTGSWSSAGPAMP